MGNQQSVQPIAAEAALRGLGRPQF